MPSTVDYCGNHPPLSPVTPPAQDLPDTDDFFERTLTDIIDGKYLVVVQGFANSEYAQPEGLKLALTQQLLTTRDAQNGRRIVVIGGGSDANIGVVYALAQELGMTTAGIYLEGALDTTHCDRFVEVKHVPGTSDRGTVMPTSGEDLFVAAMRIANGPRGRVARCCASAPTHPPKRARRRRTRRDMTSRCSGNTGRRGKPRSSTTRTSSAHSWRRVSTCVEQRFRSPACRRCGVAAMRNARRGFPTGRLVP